MTNHAADIREHMAVVCKDGARFATVDHLDGENSIKLTKDDSGQPHWIPISWVTGVDNDTVRIDRSVVHAQEEWSDTSPADL